MNIGLIIICLVSSKNETVHKPKFPLWSLYETQKILDDLCTKSGKSYMILTRNPGNGSFPSKPWGKPSRSCRAFSSNTRTKNYFLVVRKPLWYPWFLTRIIHDFLCFIQESYVFWLSYFYINCFSAFFKVIWEVIRDLKNWFPIRTISDFLDFMQGSYMISRISLKNHMWFHWFHATRMKSATQDRYWPDELRSWTWGPAWPNSMVWIKFGSRLSVWPMPIIFFSVWPIPTFPLFHTRIICFLALIFLHKLLFRVF